MNGVKEETHLINIKSAFCNLFNYSAKLCSMNPFVKEEKFVKMGQKYILIIKILESIRYTSYSSIAYNINDICTNTDIEALVIAREEKALLLFDPFENMPEEYKKYCAVLKIDKDDLEILRDLIKHPILLEIAKKPIWDCLDSIINSAKQIEKCSPRSVKLQK